MRISEQLPRVPGQREARCPFDPPAEQTQWRGSDGLQRVNWNGHSVWAVSRYEDIRAALTDPRISADTLAAGLQGSGNHDGPNAPLVFPRLDGSEHARLRRMLTKEFTVKRIEAMRGQISELASSFIDGMVGHGEPADLVEHYALPVPSLVISLLLGVPYQDHAFFQENTSIMLNLNASLEERRAANATLFGYLLDLVARKETDPGDDLISRIVATYVKSGEISRETAAMNGFILLNAGHETTANMIGLGTLALLQNPVAADRLRDTDDPAVVGNAIEELLRYLTIVHSLVVRVASEDIELGGQLVKAGDGLLLNLPTGNRDPAHVADADTFDVDRSARRHLAFGYGAHLCLGQSLARLELQIALPLLLRRLPNLRLAIPFEQVRFRQDMSIYGVHELPVTWTV